MQPPELNALIISRGRAFFAAIAGERPSLFTTSTWTGKVISTNIHETNRASSLYTPLLPS